MVRFYDVSYDGYGFRGKIAYKDYQNVEFIMQECYGKIIGLTGLDADYLTNIACDVYVPLARKGNQEIKATGTFDFTCNEDKHYVYMISRNERIEFSCKCTILDRNMEFSYLDPVVKNELIEKRLNGIKKGQFSHSFYGLSDLMKFLDITAEEALEMVGITEDQYNNVMIE